MWETNIKSVVNEDDKEVIAPMADANATCELLINAVQVDSNDNTIFMNLPGWFPIH